MARQDQRAQARRNRSIVSRVASELVEWLLTALTAPGDRSHIPDDMRPAYAVIFGQWEHLKQTSPVSLAALVCTGPAR